MEKSMLNSGPAPKPPLIPLPFEQNGRLFWSHNAIENHRAEIIAQSTGTSPNYPEPRDPDEWITAGEAGKRLGIGRRTLGRRIRSAQAAAVRP
jgi:hypothetical protein